MTKRSNSSKAAKSAEKFAKKYPKVVIALAIALAVVVIAFVILIAVRPDLLHKSFGMGDHEWGEYVVQTEATCEEAGLKYRECTMCGTKDPEVIPAAGHKLTATGNAVAPTCGAEGSEQFICSVCEEVVIETIDPTGNHEWGAYEVKNAATCGASGSEERECSVCGEKEEREIPATGNHDFGDGDICLTCGFDKSSFIGTESEILAENTLSIHFIAPEVKASGDSTLIKYGDTEVLIDAGPSKANAKTINKYLETYCTDGVLEYVISTHSDSDHISGFIGSKSGSNYDGVLYTYKVGTLINFPRTNKTEDDSLYKQYTDALAYAKSTYETKIVTALECWNNVTGKGASRTYYLDSEHKISMNILYNYYYEHDTSDENDYSVCMLLKQEYDGGEHNYLFTGDLEESGEKYLVQYNDLPEVDLFKAGHHGSKTSSTTALLSVIKPKHVAVCCCTGYNQYNAATENVFPTQKFIDRISEVTDSVYITIKEKDDKSGYEQMNGTIVFYCSGNKVKLWCSNNTVKLKDTEWFKANRTGW